MYKSSLRGTQLYCVAGTQGQVQTFAAQMTISELEEALGHDPRSNNWSNLKPAVRAIYSRVQRDTSPGRIASVRDYIRNRFFNDTLPGAFPSVSIALSEAPDFEPVKERGKELPIGTAWLAPRNRGNRILIDGLARYSGTMELTEDEKNSFAIPVNFYAPLPGKTMTEDQMGQLFYDFNAKAMAVSKAQSVSLDRSDPFIQAANKLSQMPFFVQNGGVERKKASLGKKSTAFTTQQALVRTVRGAMQGRAFQESDKIIVENPNLTWANIEQRVAELHAYFETFGLQMGDKLDHRRKRDSLLFTSPGIQALGVIYHDLAFRDGLEPQDQILFIQRLAAIDWDRHNPDWIQRLGREERDKQGQLVHVDEQGRPRVALQTSGATSVRNLIAYIRTQLGLDMLDSAPAAQEAEQAVA